mmetsp:Transcript_34893/g.33184  ORF Transcript_34893/g.33184 Transcript_34893/m.33184 type:complete len:394 (-) Transcript_34893:435-1616(-)
MIIRMIKMTLNVIRSIQSSLKHFLDVRNYYVVCPNPAELIKKYSIMPWYSDRIKIVGENSFPFKWGNISEVMIQSVVDAGVYPIDGKSTFEKTVWGRVGWFLQQLLKFYAGRVLRLHDYILLDSDVVWFKDIRFIDQCNSTGRSFFYTSSCQYHPPYMSTLGQISGVGPINAPVHRSGVVHHIVIVKSVLDDLMAVSEARFGGIPFWQVLLNVSAREMTCRAPRTNICGAGSTLSEYELYFNYARVKHPGTVSLRPLLWTNGPAPGMLFYPNPANILRSDGSKSVYMRHRQREVPEAFDKQMEADRLQGYDYIGYHSYAKRRYNELVGPDSDALCKGVAPPHNSTCSWRGLEELQELSKTHKLNSTIVYPAVRNASDWFKGCACYMVTHQSGP